MRGHWFDASRFAVWGLGRSGIAASNLLARLGREVVATDPGKVERPAGLDRAAEFVAGENIVGGADVVVVSPGLAPSNPLFSALSDDVPVVSEVEIAWAATDTPFIGITGTDGKTTTTEITAHLLGAGGLGTVAAGNIGVPLSEVVLESHDVIVAEVSAFQLWTTHDFSVTAAAFTNIAADHLDYFASWDEYVAAKRMLIANSGDALVAFNWDDPILRTWATAYRGPYVAYSTRGEPDAPGARHRWWYDGESRLVSLEGVDEGRVSFFDARDVEETGFYGRHNYANFMAAASLAHHTHGVGLDTIAGAMTEFRVGAHRVEFCGEVNGVAFYDDSKATNAHASMAGIRALPTVRPSGEALVVIAGGVDKGLELDQLASLLADRARAVILIGEIRDRFAAALGAAGFAEDRVQFSESMTDAVERAYREADGTAAVLLSPACSSFDMFDSYADRGEQFQAAVKALGHPRGVSG